MSNKDRKTRIALAKQDVSKAMLHLMGAREDSDPTVTRYINRQLDILGGVRRTLTELLEHEK